MISGNDLGSVRSVLGQASLLFLRNGLIVIATAAAMAGAALAVLLFVGHCLQSVMTACVSPLAYRWIGDRAVQVQYTRADYGLEFARFAILVVALLCFFASAASRPGGSGVIHHSSRRASRLLGRIIVFRLALLSVAFAYWAASTFILVPAFGVDSPATVLSHLGITLLGIIASSYLYAKLTFYVPAAAFYEIPESLTRCWAATRGITRTLFLVYFLVYFPFVLATVSVNLYFWLFGWRLSWVTRLAEALARWSQVDPTVTAYIVPSYIGFAGTSLVGFMMAGPISRVTFRNVYGREHRVAGVFD